MLFRLILTVKFPIINRKEKLSICLIKHHSIMTHNYMDVNGDFCAPTPMEEALNWKLSRAQSCSKCYGGYGSLLHLMWIEGWLHSHTAVPLVLHWLSSHGSPSFVVRLTTIFSVALSQLIFLIRNGPCYLCIFEDLRWSVQDTWDLPFHFSMWAT
jgi:hypothetical protein